ncbi:MAG: PaaI family thioesterase [Clostridium sp.]|nr:PaaI family thioesterase [Clostridium sp.]
MKEIRNPWVGNTEGYFCFGCCPDNEAGVKLTAYADGEEVVAVWAPEARYQGWINTLHGGVHAVLLDEICGWAVFYRLQTSGMTTRMETRYRRAVSTDEPYLVLRATLTGVRRNLAALHATLCDSQGNLCSEADCIYFTFPPEKAREMGFEPCITVGDELDMEACIARHAIRRDGREKRLHDGKA